MKLPDVPVAYTSLAPYCRCGNILTWPAEVRDQKLAPVVLTCPRCHDVVRAPFLVPFPETLPPRDPPSGQDLRRETQSYGACVAYANQTPVRDVGPVEVHTYGGLDVCPTCGRKG